MIAVPRGRIVGIAIALLLLAVATYQAGRVLRAERAIINDAGGGGMSLPLDDSFIYLQYARAIAEGHPFVYTPGNAPSTGSTSLWYPLLLVPPHWFGASPSFAIAWVFGLGILAYFLVALLAGKLGAALGGWPGGVLATVLTVSSPHLLWGALSGMEIGLYAALLLATTLAYVREREEAQQATEKRIVRRCPPATPWPSVAPASPACSRVPRARLLCRRTVLSSLAISGTSGSSGLGSLSNEQMDRSTLLMVSAGDPARTHTRPPRLPRLRPHQRHVHAGRGCVRGGG